MSAKAIVTGGAMGIGEAIADTVVSRGGNVAILDVRRPNHNDSRFHIPCDVRDEESVVASVTAATEKLGGLDQAYLNAGIGGLAPLLQMSVSDWDEIHAVNLRGVFLTLRECARVMVDRGGGSIVATGSVSGFLVDRCMAHYNSSKAGVTSLCRIAAAELGSQGVRVNVVAPGLTDSPLFATTDNLPGYRKAMTARTPLGRIGSCNEVARAAVDLAEMEWVNGNVLVADGGVSLHSPIDVVDFLPPS